MAGNATGFEYDYRFNELLQKARQITPQGDWHEILNKAVTWDLERDDQLEGYLGKGALAGIIGVRRDSSQSISTGTLTTVTWTSAELTNGGADASWDNSTKIVVATPGIYQINLSASFSNAGAGGSYRQASVYLNGAALIGATAPGSSSAPAIRLSGSIANALVALDYLEVKVQHDRGSSLNLNDARLQVSLLGKTEG